MELVPKQLQTDWFGPLAVTTLAVIGGAVLSGGHVRVAATVIGVAIVAIIAQALVLFHIDPYLVQVVLGAMILWAVGVNRWREVHLQKSLKRV